MTETEAKWAERVREWSNSGTRAEEFAAGQTYKASTLRWWATELRHRAERGGRQAGAQGGGAGATIAMARVVARGRPCNSVAAATPAAAGGVVVEVSGARIGLSRGFDAELLTQVVRVLSGAR
jgi:hypothetical protein